MQGQQLHDGIQNFRRRKRFLEKTPSPSSNYFYPIDRTFIEIGQDEDGHGGVARS